MPPDPFDGVIAAFGSAERDLQFQFAGLMERIEADSALVDLAASGSSSKASVLFETPNELAYTIIGGVAAIWRTASANIGVPSRQYPIMMQLREYGTGDRSITDGWTPLDVFFGTGPLPRRWPMPLMLPPLGRLSVRLRNDSGVALRVSLRLLAQVGPGKEVQ